MHDGKQSTQRINVLHAASIIMEIGLTTISSLRAMYYRVEQWYTASDAQ